MTTLAAQNRDENVVMSAKKGRGSECAVDVYFSADVETDGPIPGPFSILSFALVYAGAFDGKHFAPPQDHTRTFYRELKPISENFQPEATSLVARLANLGVSYTVVQLKIWRRSEEKVPPISTDWQLPRS